MYVIRVRELEISLQFDNWRAASSSFDKLWNDGYTCILYSFKDGQIKEIERTTPHMRRVGVMA